MRNQLESSKQKLLFAPLKQCKIYKPVEAQDAGELLILMQFMKSKRAVIAQQMAAISQGPSAPWADKSDDGPHPGFSISSFYSFSKVKI